VAAAWEQDGLGSRDVLDDRFDLCRGGVLVVLTLDHEYGTAYRFQVRFDVAGVETRIEPDIAPTPKGGFGVLVIAPQLRAPVAGFEDALGLFDASDRSIFDEDVRRFENQPPRTIGPAACVDQCDRCAVAVAEHDRLDDAVPAQEFRKHDLAFAVHVVGLPPFREPLRASFQSATEPRPSCNMTTTGKDASAGSTQAVSSRLPSITMSSNSVCMTKHAPHGLNGKHGTVELWR
jgi:hypothetical protein